jgi:hypothetical protein
VQRYGVGSTLQRINQYFEWDDSSERFIPLQVILNDYEFRQNGLRYSFFKILNLKVTFLANNQPSTNGFFYFKLHWAYLEDDQANFAVDDNAKLVPSYLFRNKTFHFFPPRANINIENRVVNYGEFLPTTTSFDYGYPRISFFPYSDGANITSKFFVEMDIIFRGSRCSSPVAVALGCLSFLNGEQIGMVEKKILELKSVKGGKVEKEDQKILYPFKPLHNNVLLKEEEKVESFSEEPFNDGTASLNLSQMSETEMLLHLKNKLRNKKRNERRKRAKQKKKEEEAEKEKEKAEAEGKKDPQVPNHQGDSSSD